MNNITAVGGFQNSSEILLNMLPKEERKAFDKHRIVVISAMEGYGASGSILYRIWNAIKAIFHRSDFQIARKGVERVLHILPNALGNFPEKHQSSKTPERLKRLAPAIKGNETVIAQKIMDLRIELTYLKEEETKNLDQQAFELADKRLAETRKQCLSISTNQKVVGIFIDLLAFAC